MTLIHLIHMGGEGALNYSPTFSTDVPNSTGTAVPQTLTPLHACDSHIHIVDARFASNMPTMAGATVADYRQLQRRLGTSRAIVVQPKNYGTDNSCTLDAIAQLGIESARGIGVVYPDVTDAELQRLDRGGIRGLRFSLWNASNNVTTIDMVLPLARRIDSLGWHVQLHMSGDQLVENAKLLESIPCSIVIDHMGRMPLTFGINHPSFKIITGLIDRGRTWVKLSGAYLNTEAGPPDYADATAIAKAFAVYAPERMVWGSDWPHVTEKEHKPDDALLFDLLAAWIPYESARARALVDNPATLYGFTL